MTNEQRLTEQELREADAMIALWRKFDKEKTRAETARKDVEEAILRCFAEASKEISSSIACFRQILCCTKQELEVQKAIHKEFLCRPFSLEAEIDPPAWFIKLMRPLEDQLARLTSQNQLITGIIGMLCSVNNREDLVVNTGRFFEVCIKRIEAIEDAWREVLKRVRDVHSAKQSKWIELQKSLREIIVAWFSASEARAAYLKEKNVSGLELITASTLQTPKCLVESAPVSMSKPVKTLRRRKTEKANGMPKTETLVPEPEKPWKVSIIRHTGTVLESLSMLLFSSNGDELVAALNRYCVWPRTGRITIRALRKLIGEPAASRGNGYRIPFRGINWCRLKFGRKYRMLVDINDDQRSVTLMAGHRTKLYADIGRRKDES